MLFSSAKKPEESDSSRPIQNQTPKLQITDEEVFGGSEVKLSMLYQGSDKSNQHDQKQTIKVQPQLTRTGTPIEFTHGHQTSSFTPAPNVKRINSNQDPKMLARDNSMQLQNLYFKITGKMNDNRIEENDLVRSKYREIAKEQKSQILTNFGQQFPEIVRYLQVEQANNSFATFWSKLLLLAFCYNFFTCFWMIGFPGFPEGHWFLCEVIAEAIAVVDFAIRLTFPRFFPSQWKLMFLLHDRDDDKTFLTWMRALASIPTSILVASMIRSEPAQLSAFWIACLRLLKLCRYRSFSSYFGVRTANESEQSALEICSLLFQFAMGIHTLTVVWILPSRFQGEQGWFKANGYYDYPDVPNWQKYLDSMVYVISNSGGMGFGNVVPLTNAEWACACFIFTIGCSVYLAFFASLTVSVASQNQRIMENHQQFEQCKAFAEVRHLPEGLRRKIMYYFKNLRIPFEEYKQRNKLIQDLPVSLKEEISLVANQNLIQSVKFFQFASPDFIMKICRNLKPHIAIVNQHVFYKDSAALRLFFINEGVCEVVGSDEQSLIRFLSKGAFFGEIGCLLTGKRSCSVIVRTTTILLAIMKQPLLKVLEEYPTQLKYLKSVGKQRLKKTSSDDTSEASVETKIYQQMCKLDSTQTVFGDSTNKDTNEFSNLPCIKNEFVQNMQQLKRYSVNSEGAKDSEIRNLFASTKFTDHDGSHERKTQPRFSQTKDITPDFFLVIPFSPLFMIWSAILSLVVIYDTFMVMFAFAFGFEVKGTFMVIDIVCYCLLACDMFIRAKTAITTPKTFCYSAEKVLSHYMNTWLLLDICVTFPTCYLMMIWPGKVDPKYLAWARLPRLLKLFRLVETIEIFKWNLDVRIELFGILEMFLLFGFSGHVFGCVFMLIGRRDKGGEARYDGNSMFKWIETRPYQQGINDDLSKVTPLQMYVNMFYFGIGLCGACPFADIIPFTRNELIFDLICQLWARVLWAFIIGQISSYIGELHREIATHNQKRDQVLSWMQQQHIQPKIQERYKDYQDCMWENFRGIEEKKILKSLPRSLRLEIRSFLFKNLIENWEAFPRGSQGITETVIRMLSLVVYPHYEYIITAGEVGEEMYFIVKGVVEIRSRQNEVLNTLKQGQNFGEMALLSENPIRMASAVSQTMVSLAVLTKRDFQSICEFFPQFKQQMSNMVKLRMQMNDKLMRNMNGLEQVKKDGLAVIQEASSSSSIVSDNLSESKTETKEANGVQFEKSFEEVKSNKELSSKESKGSRSSGLREPDGLTAPLQIRRTSDAVQMDEPADGTHSVEEPHPSEKEWSEQWVQNNQIDEGFQTVQTNTEGQEENTNLVRNTEMETKPPEIVSVVSTFTESSEHSSEEDVRPQLVRKKTGRVERRESIFNPFQKMETITDQLRIKDNWAQAMKINNSLVTVLVMYNMIFIPLQFGFRLEFKGYLLTFEVLTIVLYLTEVALRINYARRLQLIKSAQLSKITHEYEMELFTNQQALKEKLRQQWVKIVITLIAVFPFSLIISMTGSYEPFGWMLVLQSLRLIKLKPIIKFWRYIKRYALNILTIFQVLFYYLIIAHYLACVIIGLAIFKDDHRDTWLRRVPQPYPDPVTRATANVFDDQSRLQIYNYALYLQVNTLSNLTVGDILPVSFIEKFLFVFFIWTGTFIYNTCFANMTTVVSYLFSNNRIGFFSNQNSILSKVRNGKVTSGVINRVREFFDYIWLRHRGISFDEMRKALPTSLSSDISLTIYQKAIERSILFTDDSGNIDIPLALSVFKQIEFKQFLASDFIVKVGQHTTETYLLLEGELKVYGLHQDELLGILSEGSHFGLDLSDTWADRDEIYEFSDKFKTQFKMDFPSDNFDSRSIVHVVANSIITVGVISERTRGLLYQAFPEFKIRMQFLNRMLFQLGKVSLETHTSAKNYEISKYFCKNLQLDSILCSSQETYCSIIDRNLDHPNTKCDLSLLLKQSFLSRDKYKNLYLQELKTPRLLISEAHLWHTFDSKGNLQSKQIESLVVQSDSRLTKVLKAVQLLNIIYIAFMVPFTIAFDVPMTAGPIALESLSLMVQFIYVGSKVRTPVMVKGRKTTQLWYVLHNYNHEGLVIDAFGLLPLNLILGICLPTAELKMRTVIAVSILRLLRVISIWRGFELIEEISVQILTAGYFVILFKAIVIWFILGHFMACWWAYLNIVFERESKWTWAIQQEILSKSYAEQYLRLYYFTLNIATGIGSGDMVPQNDLERFGVILFVNVGDSIWVFGFGLITYFFTLAISMDSKAEIRNKIKQLQELMTAYQMTASERRNMEKYFAYQFYQSQHAKIIDQQDLLNHLPFSVVQEIVVQTNEAMLASIFSSINSENLIRELCLALQGKIFLPQDFIWNQGEIAIEILFIADGTVHLLAQDRDTIAMTLTKGEYFGEIEVLDETRRSFYAQAATFCTLCSLTKKDIDQISIVFPQLTQKLESEAKDKKGQLQYFVVANAQHPFIEEQNRLMEQFMETSDAEESQDQVRGTPLSQVLMDRLGQSYPVTALKADQGLTPERAKRRRHSTSSGLVKSRSSSDNGARRRANSVEADSGEERSNKRGRRLSNISFGKLHGKQNGLKLQWNVQNEKNQNGWL